MVWARENLSEGLPSFVYARHGHLMVVSPTPTALLHANQFVHLVLRKAHARPPPPPRPKTKRKHALHDPACTEQRQKTKEDKRNTRVFYLSRRAPSAAPLHTRTPPKPFHRSRPNGLFSLSSCSMLTGEVGVVVQPRKKVLADGGVRVSRQQRHDVVVAFVAALHHQGEVRRVGPVVGRARGGLVLVRAGDAAWGVAGRGGGRYEIVA